LKGKPRNSGHFPIFSGEFSQLSLQCRLLGGGRGIRTLGPVLPIAHPEKLNGVMSYWTWLSTGEDGSHLPAPDGRRSRCAPDLTRLIGVDFRMTPKAKCDQVVFRVVLIFPFRKRIASRKKWKKRCAVMCARLATLLSTSAPKRRKRESRRHHPRTKNKHRVGRRFTLTKKTIRLPAARTSYRSPLPRADGKVCRYTFLA